MILKHAWTYFFDKYTYTKELNYELIDGEFSIEFKTLCFKNNY